MGYLLKKANTLWNEEHIRVLVLTSLTLQVVLTFFAPHRKRSGDKRLAFLLWVVYQGVSSVPEMALSDILTNSPFSTEEILTSFWAPFLLIHRGGPDNITSYSIEDNMLWWRYLIGALVQASVVFIVVLQYNLQSTKLLVPSILIFLVAIIKIGEKTFALRAANKRPLGNPFMNEQPSLIPQESSKVEIKGKSDADLIYLGQHLSSIMRTNMNMHGGLVSVEEPQVWKGREFEIISIELSFFYDDLYTKMSVIHSRKGCFLRIASLASIIIALILFHNSEKRCYDRSDVIVTYILVSIALVLEIYSFLLLTISKQTIVSLLRSNCRNDAEFVWRAMNYVLSHDNKRWWSGDMGQYTLTQFYLKSLMREEKNKHRCHRHILSLPDKFGNAWGFLSNAFKNAWDFLLGEKQSAKVSSVLEKMMIEYVENLVKKEADEKNYYSIMELKSSWKANTLRKYNLNMADIEGETFEEWMIALHMVTKTCYLASSNDKDTDHGKIREAINSLSNYMVYLLFKQSSMMPLGVSKFRLGDKMDSIRSRLSKFFESLRPDARLKEKREVRPLTEGSLCLCLCSSTDHCDTTFPLYDTLTNELRCNGESSSIGKQWEVIRDAWMEMLTFAALRCSPSEHAKALRSGGELLTHFWMLWAHSFLFKKVKCNENSDVEDTDAEEKLNCQVAAMQAELSRMNEENQLLTERLNQVTTYCNAHHMHPISLMQSRNIPQDDDEIMEMETEPVVPMQFLDPGRAFIDGREDSEHDFYGGGGFSSGAGFFS